MTMISPIGIKPYWADIKERNKELIHALERYNEAYYTDKADLYGGDIITTMIVFAQEIICNCDRANNMRILEQSRGIIDSGFGSIGSTSDVKESMTAGLEYVDNMVKEMSKGFATESAPVPGTNIDNTQRNIKSEENEVISDDKSSLITDPPEDNVSENNIVQEYQKTPYSRVMKAIESVVDKHLTRAKNLQLKMSIYDDICTIVNEHLGELPHNTITKLRSRDQHLTKSVLDRLLGVCGQENKYVMIKPTVSSYMITKLKGD